MDEIDARLIAALERNARASMTALARVTGLSRSATHDRIARLEERGVIRGYRAEVDAEAAGLVEAMLTVRFAAGQDNDAFAEAITAYDHVARVHCVTGEDDIVLHARAATTSAINALRQKIAATEGVASISTATILSTRVPR
ncbi:Lrp/AsnC family transcriptional regulator [Sphingomicrobium arenosum]|uniref:Lrp/AsnC family transcriptional regulator n=1 Tax=Sphingomicrobium arenosum TaxID=2233861 RepID=UPI002240E9ED|nr:Lrp/AsnC family transcriptional regulator [Sphingomicrobium arenosum]